MANNSPNRFSGYMSPEDRLENAQRAGPQARDLDGEIKEAYAKLKKKERAESYGQGPQLKKEVLGHFEKSAWTIRGSRSRLYAGAMQEVAMIETRIQERERNIQELDADKKMYQEALQQISATTSWWRIDQKAKVGLLSAKESVFAGARTLKEESIKGVWSFTKSLAEWEAELWKGDIEANYERAKHDLESTAKMEKIIGQFYSKALVYVTVEELTAKGLPADKADKVLLLKGLKGDEFSTKWKELKAELSEEEMGVLSKTLESKLDKKERNMIGRLSEQVDSIYARKDVHDYQEIKYLQDVQKNMMNGKKLYLGLIFPDIADSVSWQKQLKRLQEDSPNLAYMICDAASHYRGKDEKLEDVLGRLFVTGGQPNNSFRDQLSAINARSVNQLVRVDFLVHQSLDQERTKTLTSLTAVGEAFKGKPEDSLDALKSIQINWDSDFKAIALHNKSIPEVAYDILTRVPAIKKMDDKDNREKAAYVVAAKLIKKQKDPTYAYSTPLEKSDLNTPLAQAA